MSKGRPATLPPQGGHSRPENMSGLVVRHVNEKGDESAEYDFAALPLPPALQRDLAEVFAARARSTGAWRSLPSSQQAFWSLKIFARWLVDHDEVPGSISELTRASWVQFRLATINNTSGTLRALRITRMLLLESGKLRGEARTEVVRRIPKEVAEESAYTDDELRRVTIAARSVFRAARERIRTNLTHLRRFRDGAFEAGTTEHALGEALEIIAATGDAPRIWHLRDRPVVWSVAVVLGGQGKENTWKRLYLDHAEAAAALVLLACKEGWNETSIAELSVPTRIDGTAITSTSLTYRVELEKRRRRAPHRYETRTLTDTGADSTARLLAQIVEITQPARDLLSAHGNQTDRLLISRKNRIASRADQMMAKGLAPGAKNMLAHSTGVLVSLRRVRKAVNTRHLRQPNQNSRATHDSVYLLRDPGVFADVEPVIAAGVTKAISHASQTTKVLLDDDRSLGEDTATATCVDFERSPYSPWGVECRASFLLCLACHNAVVMPRHLGRLAYLHEALGNLSLSLPAETWARDWANHYDRLHGLRTLHYSDAQWVAALESITDTDRNIVDGLLRGDFDT